MAANSLESPLEALASAPMRARQYLMVGLCCLINLIDGYDVVSLSYAAPVLTKEWHTKAQMLGLVFSAASLGLTLGAFLLAPLSDRFGRRPMMLAALVSITVSHALTSVAYSIQELIWLRFLMGLGLGLLVVSLNVMVSEYANDQRRTLLLALLHAGFTGGMMLGGVLSALVLEPFGWRAIFTAGTIINVVLLTLLLVFMWESPSFLLRAQPANALARVNRILGRLGHAPLAALPPKPVRERRGGQLAALLANEQRVTNLLYWFASLTYAVVGYFLLNWKPKVLVDAGLTPTEAGWIGASVGVAGILGHLSMGWLSRRGGSIGYTAAYFALIGVSLLVFGNAPNKAMLIAAAAMLQFFTVGAYTGLFLNAVELYPPEQRNLGISIMVGFGRLGAIVGPYLGGVLIGADLGRAQTMGVFAAISVIPVVALVMLGRGAARQARSPAAAAV
ncbi:MAG: MFS transporter [Novosphingobium sp.]|nr:MFS transporter [Novosphingobium sp.]